MSVRLLIADDHEVVRVGLAHLLAGTDIEIVAKAASGDECLKLAEKHRPDVVLLDVRMPDGDGLETLEKLRQKVPNAKVVMLSTYDIPTYVARAATFGASDYVLKGATRQGIIDAILAAAAGQSPSHPGQLRPLAETMKSRKVIEDDQRRDRKDRRE